VLVWAQPREAPESHPLSPALLRFLQELERWPRLQRDEAGGGGVNALIAAGCGFAAGVILFAAMTGFCLTNPAYVYVVKHRACVPERAFVPVGYIPEVGR